MRRRSLRPFLDGGQPAKWRDAAHWEFDFRSIKDEASRRFDISIDECCLAWCVQHAEYIHFAACAALYDIAEDPRSSTTSRPAGLCRRRARHGAPQLSWRMAFNRREMTGIRLQTAPRSTPRAAGERFERFAGALRIAGVREIAERYRTWFWTPMASGIRLRLPGVVEALILARRGGVTVVIVTNSGQRVDAVAVRLAGAGIAPDCYDHIMSSGELSWRHIEQLDALSRLFLLYPSGGPLWLNHLRNPIVDDLAQADLMVVAGMPHRTAAAACAGDLLAMLETAAAFRLPLLVPDSDVTTRTTVFVTVGTGGIARHYAELGGQNLEFEQALAPIFAPPPPANCATQSRNR